MKDDRKEIVKYVGRRCFYFRKQMELTVEEAAEKLGLSPRTLHAYERGEREMTVDTAIKLAECYNTTLTNLTNYKNIFAELASKNAENKR